MVPVDPEQSRSKVRVERVIEFSTALEEAAFVYVGAFSGPPYFETYDVSRVVKEILAPHIPFYLLFAYVGDQVVGLISAHPVMGNLNRSDLSFIIDQLPRPEETIYVSELAVSSTFRGRGIGGSLIAAVKRVAKAEGYRHFCTRTAAEGSNSLRLFQKAGGILVPSEQAVTNSKIATSSGKRVWLIGPNQG